MFDAARLVRENRWTALMLLAVVLLYSALFLAGIFSSADPANPVLKQKDGFTTEELKQKEETARHNLLARPGLTAAVSLIFLAVVAAGLALDAYLLTKGFRERPWAAPFPPGTEARWGLREVAQVFIFTFFVEGILFTIQVFWYWATGLEKTQQDFFLLGNTLVRDLCMAGFIWLLLRFRGQSWKDLGFRAERFLKNVRTGVLGYIAVIPPMLLSFFILAILMQLFSYEPVPQNVVQIYLKKNPGVYLVLFTMFVAVAGPLLEELFFRGFAYPALKKRFGVMTAMAATAGVFAAFHMSVTAFVPVFLLGFFLTYLYESTGSLVPSITAHVLHNTLMVSLTLGFRALSGPA